MIFLAAADEKPYPICFTLYLRDNYLRVVVKLTPHRSNEELVSPFEIGDGKIKSPLC